MAERYPDIRYKPIPDEPDEAADTSGPLNRVFLWLTWAILAFCLLVWAVVGAVFWVPLMLRTMVMFSIALVHSTIEGARPSAAARMLRDAVTFYRRGFEVAVEAVMGEEDDQDSSSKPLQRKGLFREVLWAAAVWYLFLLLLGLDLWSPLQAWDWLRGLPWEAWVGGLLEGVGGLFEGASGGDTPTSG